MYFIFFSLLKLFEKPDVTFQIFGVKHNQNFLEIMPFDSKFI